MLNYFDLRDKIVGPIVSLVRSFHCSCLFLIRRKSCRKVQQWTCYGSVLPDLLCGEEVLSAIRKRTDPAFHETAPTECGVLPVPYRVHELAGHHWGLGEWTLLLVAIVFTFSEPRIHTYRRY